MVTTIAAISFVYDVAAGVTLLLFHDPLSVWFGLAPAQPAIYMQLNGIFVTCVGVGYLLPYRDPVRYRAYLWIFGVALKAAGAVAFVLEYMRGSPSAFLLFALSDGALAVATLWALRDRR